MNDKICVEISVKDAKIDCNLTGVSDEMLNIFFQGTVGEMNRRKAEKRGETVESWSNSTTEDELLQGIETIKVLGEAIINDDDKPACVHDDECIIKGGPGFDNHCSSRCPYVLASGILKIAEGLTNGK